MSVLYRMDAAGNVKEARAMRSVIRSRARLSYEDANERLQVAADDEMSTALHTLRKVCQGIRARRAERGSIDFALPETYVELDAEGMPSAIRPRPRLETNRIVEDLMILTNETVARIGEQNELPVLYRIHEPPSEDRLEGLRRVAGVFDAPLTADPVRPTDVARLVAKMAGRPQEYLVSMVALRSMKQARYATRNVGHFGLGSEAYLHFTSPIRRYPDLVVHRALVRWLAGKGTEVDIEALERTARHTSERERRAESAERDSVELKKIQYMTRHLGDTFEGTIAGVTGFGMFILLDDVLVEGLIRLSSLVDDYYHYDEGTWSLTGRRSKRRFRLGDRVEVQVARVDPESREIDLELLKGPLDPGRLRD
jgi:ribonuclease R